MDNNQHVFVSVGQVTETFKDFKNKIEELRSARIVSIVIVILTIAIFTWRNLSNFGDPLAKINLSISKADYHYYRFHPILLSAFIVRKL
mmetsp:Transcript_9053/g.11785  ORF Transcript_9053/g.11785 Transcript_9053/m.11785 type:complete len:89 (+) Transcript_9053:949-1215(+)